MDTLALRPLTLCHFTTVEVEPPDFVDLAVFLSKPEAPGPPQGLP